LAAVLAGACLLDKAPWPSSSGSGQGVCPRLLYRIAGEPDRPILEVVGGGDVDGDGTPDALVASTAFEFGADPVRMYAFSGRDGRLLRDIRVEDLGDDAVLADVSPAGDLDGDGRADLAASYVSGDPRKIGERGQRPLGVLVLSGREGRTLRRFETDLLLGVSPARTRRIAGGTDIDGDGTPDLLVGGPDTEVRGDSPAGTVVALSGARGEELFRITGDDSQPSIGRSVAFVGDVDGDGNPDVAAGNGDNRDGEGALEPGIVLVYSGADGRLLHSIWFARDDVGNPGMSLAGPGDVDGDGHADILAGAPLARDSEGRQTGRAYVFSGRDGLELLRIDGEPAPRTLRGRDCGGLGLAVLGLGDLDGDGHPDLAASSPALTATEFVHRTEALVLSGADGAELARMDGPEIRQHHYLMASVAALGDVDGDGRSDLAIAGNGPPDQETGDRHGAVDVYSLEACGE